MGDTSEKTAQETWEQVEESGATVLTAEAALNMLANTNDWLKDAIASNRDCNCNACFLCAYNVLKNAIRTDNVQPDSAA